jgi:hypothetical protein
MQLLEVEPSAISTLFKNASTVVTKILELFGTVSTTLLNNSIFQLVMGLIILGIIITLVFMMLGKIKLRKRR